MEKRECVVDLDIILVNRVNLMGILKARDLLMPAETGKVIILEQIFREIEQKKKNPNVNLNVEAIKLYSSLYDFIEQNPNEVEFKNTDYGYRAEIIVNYCMENNAELMTCDKMLYLKYKATMEKKGYEVKSLLMDIEELKKLSKVYGIIENLDEKILRDTLERIVNGSGTIDLIDFIALSEEKRYDFILDSIVDKLLGSKSETIKDKVKDKIKGFKIEKIDNEMLKRIIDGVQTLKLGDLKFKQPSVLESNRKIIEKFLLEKGFESFEELKKYHPFESEEVLVQGILKYYSK